MVSTIISLAIDRSSDVVMLGIVNIVNVLRKMDMSTV